MRPSSLATFVRLVLSTKSWTVALSDYLQRTKPGILELATRSGLRYQMRARTTDREIYTEVCVKKVYTPEGFHINEKDIVLDIGAHIGIFSVYAASFARFGTVYAFEPDPRNYQLLLKNVELNHLTNIRSANTAVAGRSGSRSLFLSDDGGWNSFFRLENASRETEVVATTLEDIILGNGIRRVDFLKMDCEGAEYEILFGCPDSTLATLSRISMECHDMDEELTAKKMSQFLVDKGFEVSSISDPVNPKLHMLRACRP